MLTFGLLGSSVSSHPIPDLKNNGTSELTSGTQDFNNQDGETPNNSLMELPSSLERKYADAPALNDAIDAYHAHSPQKSKASPLSGKIRNEDVIIDHYLKVVKIQLEYLKGPDLSHTVFKEAIETMIDIAKYKKKEAHLINTENIPRKSREQLDSLASLFNDAKIIYKDIENKLEGSNLKKNKILKIKAGIETRLGKIEEVVESYRGGKITDKVLTYSYYPNFKKRFKELSSELKETTPFIDHVESMSVKYSNEARLFNKCSKTDFKNVDRFTRCDLLDNSRTNEDRDKDFSSLENRINELQIKIVNIESAMINERDSIKWFLQSDKIMSYKMATSYINKYDEKINELKQKDYVSELNEYKKNFIKKDDPYLARKLQSAQMKACFINTRGKLPYEDRIKICKLTPITPQGR